MFYSDKTSNTVALIHADRRRMRRLIKANLTATGQLDRRLQSPVFLFGERAAHALCLQGFHERRQVVAHEVENRAQKLPSAMGLTSLAIGWMNPGLCRR